MKLFLREAGSAAAGRRRRQRSTVLVAAALLLWWFALVLGPDLPWLLDAIAASLIAVWVLRHHHAIALCAAIAAVTAAAPAVASVILIDRQVTGAPDLAAVLTGYILVAPVPALVACTLRPALVNRPVNTLLGSAVLLLSAVPVVVLGDQGEGAAALVVALTASVAVLWYRHGRAAAALLAALPLVNDWTDLGPRTLPDGPRIDRLLIGQGHAIACSTITSAALEEDYLSTARTAVATANALGMAGSQVQPVILTNQENPCIETHLVNDGKVAASVMVTDHRLIEDVIRLAPRRCRRQRRAVLTAALLPVPTAGPATR